MSWRRLSDDQFIVRIRRFHNRRRRWGLVLFLVGAACTAGLYLAHLWLTDEGLKRMTSLERELQELPLDPETSKSLVETRMLTGFVIGFSMGFGMVGATIAAGYGFCLFLGVRDRKTDLLLKYYDAQHGSPNDSHSSE